MWRITDFELPEQVLISNRELMDWELGEALCPPQLFKEIIETPRGLVNYLPFNSDNRMRAANWAKNFWELDMSFNFWILVFEEAKKNPNSSILLRTNISSRLLSDERAKLTLLTPYRLEDYISACDLYGYGNEFLLRENMINNKSFLEAFEENPLECIEAVIPRKDWKY